MAGVRALFALALLAGCAGTTAPVVIAPVAAPTKTLASDTAILEARWAQAGHKDEPIQDDVTLWAAVDLIDRHMASTCPALRAYLYESGNLSRVSVSAFRAWDGRSSDLRVERVGFFLALELTALDLPPCRTNAQLDLVHL